ncbi:head fiber protein [Shigella phage CWP003]|nr:head fiber protein [Shigella phage CWP003]
MTIPISTFPLSGQTPVLPAVYANGLAIVSEFTSDKNLIVPLSPPLASGYNSVGQFFMIGNDGDSTSKPNLTLSVPKMNITDVQTGLTASTITIAFGEAVIIGMESGGSKNAVAVKVVKSSSNQYTLPAATASVLGGVKIGSGISVAGDGTISVTQYSLPIASASTLGGIKVGTTLSIDGSGVLNAAASTVQNASNSVSNPPTTLVNLATLNLPAGKWLVTASQLTVATAGVQANTGITVKLSTSNSDITDDAFTMSAGIRAAGRFGGNIPTKIITLAAPGNVYLNYQCTDALTSTVYGQITAIKLN